MTIESIKSNLEAIMVLLNEIIAREQCAEMPENPLMVPQQMYVLEFDPNVPSRPPGNNHVHANDSCCCNVL